jgi:hypothetical protein
MGKNVVEKLICQPYAEFLPALFAKMAQIHGLRAILSFQTDRAGVLARNAASGLPPVDK